MLTLLSEVSGKQLVFNSGRMIDHTATDLWDMHFDFTLDCLEVKFFDCIAQK